MTQQQPLSKEEVRQLMQNHGEEFHKAAETFFRKEVTAVRGVYVDLTCLKDTRLGLLLSLANTPEEQQYLRDHLVEYNNRPRRSFIKDAYPDFKMTEEQLESIYYKLYQGEDIATDYIFDRSPDTTLILFLSSLLSIYDQRRIAYEIGGKLIVTVNCWPLKQTPLVDIYRKCLSTYFDPTRVIVKLISVDPVTLPAHMWTDHQVFFFDSLTRLVRPTSTFFTPFFKHESFLDSYIYAPYEVEDKIYEEWKEKGVDLSDEETFVDMFSGTQAYLSFCCHFSYLSMDVPIGQDQQVKTPEKATAKARVHVQPPRPTPPRADEQTPKKDTRAQKKSPFARIYTPR